MIFKFELELGNAMMLNGRHVARAMFKAAEKIRGMKLRADGKPPADLSYGVIHDENGNRVGQWEFISRKEGA